jgi:hypothetical protein
MQVDNNGANSFIIKGSKTEVDVITKNLIKNQYSIEDEISILRRTLEAIINNKPIPNDFDIWSNFVNNIIEENKKIKPGG